MSLATRQGEALHTLLEQSDRLWPTPLWRLEAVWPQRLLAPYGLTVLQQQEVWESALRLLAHPGVAELMGLSIEEGRDEASAAGQREVLIEREWLDATGSLRRPDRVVLEPARAVGQPDVCRILDFKWRVLTSEQSDYARQLREYSQTLTPHYPTHRVEAFILSATPEIWRLTESGLVHWEPAGRPAL